MSEVPLAAVVTQVFIPPVSEAPLAAVQQRERDTMHPHFMTAMLRVDAIPIHRARKYSTGETPARDDGEGCLIKQLQRQGFAVILADVLAGMVGPLIKTAKLVDRPSPAPTSGMRVAVQALHQLACVEQS